MAKRRRKKKMPSVPLPAVILLMLLSGALVFFAPRLVHKCDSCGRVFVGTGYRPNAVVDAVNEDELILCESCAEKQHAVSGFFGGDLKDYQRKLFE